MERDSLPSAAAGPPGEWPVAAALRSGESVSGVVEEEGLERELLDLSALDSLRSTHSARALWMSSHQESTSLGSFHIRVWMVYSRGGWIEREVGVILSNRTSRPVVVLCQRIMEHSL